MYALYLDISVLPQSSKEFLFQLGIDSSEFLKFSAEILPSTVIFGANSVDIETKTLRQKKFHGTTNKFIGQEKRYLTFYFFLQYIFSTW